MTASKLTQNQRSGFALVSAVSVLALLLLIGLAILSLSTSTSRESKVERHTEIARANARMALAIAIAQLQEALGPDQRVSATADILNNDAPGGVGLTGVISGREKWLGVWKNTVTSNDREYPLIGKVPDDGSGNSPYELTGVYNDLRASDPTLVDGAWKNELHQSWLVSGSESDALVEGSAEMEELVSERNSILSSDPSGDDVTVIPAVSVPKVSVDEGNYAYWISEENHKAPLHLTYRDPSASGLANFPHAEGERVAHLGAAPVVDVSGIRTGTGTQAFEGFPEFNPDGGNLEENVRDISKMLTRDTASLVETSDRGAEAVKDLIHDVSVYSQGLPIDPVLGGLKKDLTPLLFGGGDETVSFNPPNATASNQGFSSNFPIIPGFRHGFSGPKFASFRHWASMAIPYGETMTAETRPFNEGSRDTLRERSSEGWAWSTEDLSVPWWKAGHDRLNDTRHVSDGVYTSESEWAESGAKFHPVMTDARWYYYCSPNFTAGATNKKIRFHIIPRVGLWNPYNRPMEVPDLLVMMPNPFAQQQGTAKLVFGESVWRAVINRARMVLAIDGNNRPIAGRTPSVDPESKEFAMWDLFSKWRRVNRFLSVDDRARREISGEFGLRIYSGERSDADRGDLADPGIGLVPPSRWLAFVLEAQTLAPGQNAVYSPVTTGAAISGGGGVGQSEPYNISDVLQNRLSAEVPQSELNSFFHEHTMTFVAMQHQNRGADADKAIYAQRNRAGRVINNNTRVSAPRDRAWVNFGPGANKNTGFFVPMEFVDTIPEFDFAETKEVLIQGESDENFPFMLKAINSNRSASVSEIAGSAGSASGSRAEDFPTLQLMLHGNSGLVGSVVSRSQFTIGSPTAATFGGFQFVPYESIPASAQQIPPNHVVGTKMLWLNEENAEGQGGTPFRAAIWDSTDTPSDPVYKAFNPASIADWNLRAGLITRSPSSPATRSATTFGGALGDEGEANVSSAAYLRTNGAWSLQVASINPTNTNGAEPQISDINGLESKNPFLEAGANNSDRNVVLFDIPDPDTGILSLMDFRHAPLSQNSYHPTYVVGSSKADIHAPRMYTANEGWAEATESNSENFIASVLGTGDTASGSVGPTSIPPSITNRDRRIGHAPNFGHIYPKEGSGRMVRFLDVEGESRSATAEIPFFDIAFETNQNLWDQFFLSGTPILNDRSSTWDATAPSINQRYKFNTDASLTSREVENILDSEGDRLDWLFWNMAEVIKVNGQFNINSTSVSAWRAVLGSNKQFALALADGSNIDQGNVKFSRFHRPVSSTNSSASLFGGDGWDSSRTMISSELDILAQFIVQEVKERGPFISLSDFVNRRLGESSNPHTRMGAIDSAIANAQLNAQFVSELASLSSDPTDSNHASYKENTDSANIEETNLADSRAFGFPGYLMQSDILAPLAANISVRGESFIIRTYGDSMENGVVRAKAYLEAVVVRSPDYVDSENEATDASSTMDYSNGEILPGTLTPSNQKYGRKFIVKNTRWISGPEA